MKVQHARKKTKEPAARTAPDIPADIQQVTADMIADSEIAVRECLIENASFTDRSLNSAVFEACVLKHVRIYAMQPDGIAIEGRAPDRM